MGTKFIFLAAFGLWLTSEARAGLIINAAEIGVGKFHRYDHSKHPYENTNAWKNFVLPDLSAVETPIVIPTPDSQSSVTIFFSTLEQLIQSSTQVALERGQSISVLNINGHGIPGGMWYPKDQSDLQSWGCSQWRDSAEAADVENYVQYYSPISKNEIMQMRQFSEQVGNFPCVSGLSAWREVVARNPNFKAQLASDVQVHFLSCIVGLGPVGAAFTRGIANLLFKTSAARVETSMNFGLGDWSMPEGMGFWDFQNDEQLARDNLNYPENRRDRDMQQKGTIRVAQLQTAGPAVSGFLTQVNFMELGADARPVEYLTAKTSSLRSPLWLKPLPQSIRIPGTNATVRREVREIPDMRAD